MRVIARNTLVEFGKQHPQTSASLEHWFRIASVANWSNTQDVLASFSKAKVINAERVRFEVQGGNFRMIVAFEFRRKIAFVKFIGTHAAFDRIDAHTVRLR